MSRPALVRDSRGALTTDPGPVRHVAHVLATQAEREHGRSLTYADPTGDAATWSVLIEHVRATLYPNPDTRSTP